jgi:hypothetical protein
MTHEPIKIHEYEITEERIANLATEFFGTVVYPAGNHQLVHLSFEGQPDSSRAELRQQFMRALESYRRKSA